MSWKSEVTTVCVCNVGVS